jgi:transposase
VLRLLETSGKTAAQLEAELGIGSTNISRWNREFANEGIEAFPGKGHQTEAEEEMRRLQRKVEILCQERDILKKAVAIFSQEKG